MLPPARNGEADTLKLNFQRHAVSMITNGESCHPTKSFGSPTAINCSHLITMLAWTAVSFKSVGISSDLRCRVPQNADGTQGPETSKPLLEAIAITSVDIFSPRGASPGTRFRMKLGGPILTCYGYSIGPIDSPLCCQFC